MTFDPTVESDPQIMLMRFEHLALQNPDVLTDETAQEIVRELQGLIPRGHYAGPPGGVSVELVGRDPNKPTIAGFYVQFRRLCDNVDERVPVAHFLETYRQIGVDMV